MNNKIIIKTIPFAEYTEYHITIKRGFLNKPIFEKILNNLKKSGTRIIKTNLLGDINELKKYIQFAKKIPLLALGDSISNNKTVGAYICAIKPNTSEKIKFLYIKNKQKIITGVYFKTKNFSFLSKTGLSDKTKNKNFNDETKNEYKEIEKMLGKYRFNFKDIHRFWNYMGDILNYYADFNKTRDFYFNKHHIVKYPAATGIEAKLINKNIFIGFEAIKGKNIKIKTLSSNMQKEAYKYGSKFSRAILLSNNNIKKIYVSGTSSIDKNGKSILTSQPRKNIEYVIKAIKNILSQENLTMNDITMSYVYGINNSILDIFKKIYAKKHFNFPFIELETPICRKDLLFEMECIAQRNDFYV
jgi:enamine deaminase RidA (YjgF/YER057c/UK114 family)